MQQSAEFYVGANNQYIYTTTDSHNVVPVYASTNPNQFYSQTNPMNTVTLNPIYTHTHTQPNTMYDGLHDQLLLNVYDDTNDQIIPNEAIINDNDNNDNNKMTKNNFMVLLFIIIVILIVGGFLLYFFH